MEFLGRVAFEFESMRPLLPTYLHLLVSAIFPIYTAAHASLSRPSSAAPRKRKRGKGGSNEGDEEDRDEGEDESQRIDGLTPSDAILFPLLAGTMLASLYFVLKWLQDPAWLNWILGVYFSQLGLFMATKFLKDVFSVARSFAFPRQYSRQGLLWKVDEEASRFKTDSGESTDSPFPGFLHILPLPAPLSRRVWGLRRLLYAKAKLHFHLHQVITVKAPVDVLDVAGFVLASAIVGFHAFVSKPWFFTNFLGFSFCYGSLQYMTPTTAWTGTLVLGALFFYDIYFVFFTPMMVTVATKLDVPIKLLFPRPDGCVFPVGAPADSAAMQEYLQCLAKKRTMAMLGLGDIVVPGMMLAFALRFDLFLHYLRRSSQGKGETPRDENGQEKKAVYVNAKGDWGERFWTRSRLWPADTQAKSFPKPYFSATIFGYLAGMVTTIVVMQVAEHAQPALLYLVPGVLLSLWGTALLRGDLQELWRYSELPEDEDKTQDGDTTEKSEATTGKAEETATTSKSLVQRWKELFGNTDPEKNPDATAEKPAEDKKSEKEKAMEKAESRCRQLISFSITLPDLPGGKTPAGDGTKASEPGESIAQPESTTPGAKAESDEAGITSEDGHMDESKGKDQVQTQANRADGEPPGKRARRE
jgi:minor histocompatibility antigen H13